MTSGFEQASARLDGIAQEQTGLRAQVAAGQLWMEAGVAEEAADRCDQAVVEINQWLNDARRLAQKRQFGANEDGRAASIRFASSGQEYMAVMEHARTVFEHMAATYRAAGRTVAEADAAGQQVFGGRSG